MQQPVLILSIMKSSQPIYFRNLRSNPEHNKIMPPSFPNKSCENMSILFLTVNKISSFQKMYCTTLLFTSGLTRWCSSFQKSSSASMATAVHPIVVGLHISFFNTKQKLHVHVHVSNCKSVLERDRHYSISFSVLLISKISRFCCYMYMLLFLW
jgi:hypothetical protein